MEILPSSLLSWYVVLPENNSEVNVSDSLPSSVNVPAEVCAKFVILQRVANVEYHQRDAEDSIF